VEQVNPSVKGDHTPPGEKEKGLGEDAGRRKLPFSTFWIRGVETEPEP